MGAHWTDDNTIVFATLEGIWKVPASGGSPELLIKNEGMRRYQHPQLLPGGRALLVTALDPKRTNAWSLADIIVKPLDGAAEKRVANGGDARYLPTGHVVFVVNGTLMAVPFDVGTLTAGNQVALVEPIAESNANTGAFHFDVSASGTLVYATATRVSGELYLPVWVDRKGKETPLDTERRTYRYVRLSADNMRAAFDVEGDNRDIWIWNVQQNAMSRLTTDVGNDRVPVFTRDGHRVIYSKDTDTIANLFWQSADGVDKPEQLTRGTDTMFAMTTAPDGTVLVRRSVGAGGGNSADIYAMPLQGDRTLKPLINDPQFIEQNAEVSHNGRWLAYQTNRSGREEVFVRPYPALDTESPVSTAGGSEPLWSTDDSELFFRSPTGAIMRVRVTAGQTFKASTPEQLLPGEGLRRGQTQGSPYRTYDISRDGLRFLVLKSVPSQVRGPTGPDMIVVQNFAEELKRRVRAK
jgi:serine/threonine-protein kinase